MTDLETRVARLERLVDRLAEDLDAAEALIERLVASRDSMRTQIAALRHEAGLDR